MTLNSSKVNGPTRRRDGQIGRLRPFKARLVTKGFNKKEGIDYDKKKKKKKKKIIYSYA
jgi:hypothetical protein